jgi:ribosomal protein S17E
LVARKESELVVKRAAQSMRLPYGAKFKKKFAVNFEVLLTA